MKLVDGGWSLFYVLYFTMSHVNFHLIVSYSTLKLKTSHGLQALHFIEQVISITLEKYHVIILTGPCSCKLRSDEVWRWLKPDRWNTGESDTFNMINCHLLSAWQNAQMINFFSFMIFFWFLISVYSYSVWICNSCISFCLFATYKLPISCKNQLSICAK